MAGRTHNDVTVDTLHTNKSLSLASTDVLPPVPRTAGTVIYDSDTRTPMYSTGLNWVAMGGGGAYTLFTFAPNIESNFTALDPNTFAVWSDLVAALSQSPGTKLITFSLRGSGSNTTIPIPAGTYDLSDCIFWLGGSLAEDYGPLSAGLQIDLSVDGVFFNGLVGIDGNLQVNINQLLATGAVMATASATNAPLTQFFMTNKATLNSEAAATAPFIQVDEAGSVVVIMGKDAYSVVQGAGPVFLINSTNAGNLAIQIREGVQGWTSGAIQGSAGATRTLLLYRYSAATGWSVPTQWSTDATVYPGVDVVTVFDRTAGSATGTVAAGVPRVHIASASPSTAASALVGYLAGDLWVNTAGSAAAETALYTCTAAAAGTWISL
jgi:hypothetical protein